MDYRFDHLRRRSPLIRFLFHPMLYISLLLHGIVVAIPGNPEPEIDPEQLEEEQEINITSLDPIVRPTSEAEPEPEEPSTPPPAATPPQPQPSAPAPVAPQPQAIQIPTPQPSAAPSPAATPTASPEPSPQSLPEFDPSPFREQIASGIQSSSNYFDLGGRVPPPNYFRESSAYFDGDDLKSGIIPGRVYLLNDVDLTQTQDEGVVSAFRPEEYVPAGMTVNQIEDYGGGPLYEVMNSDDQVVAYLNATRSATGPSTILVFWEFDPNSPPEESSEATQ